MTQPVQQVKQPVYQRAFFVLATFVLTGYLLIIGAGLFIPLMLGAFFAMLLAPVSGKIEEWRIGRLNAAFLPVAGLIAALLVLFGLAVGQITRIMSSLEDAQERISSLLNRVNEALQWHLHLDEPIFKGFDGADVVGYLRDNAGGILFFMGGVAGLLFWAFLVPVFALFFLYYRYHFFEFGIRLFRKSPRAVVEEQTEKIRRVAQNYLTGLFKVISILAVLNSTALWLIGVEHAIFFGVFAAILNAVPYLGPVLGSILPTLFVLITKDSLYYPLAVLATFVVIQSIESYLLTPNIIGNNVRLNPMAAFAGLLVGGMVWGIVGMILAIPLLSIGMQLMRLSDSTAPYAFLLGAPEKRRRPSVSQAAPDRGP